MPNREGRVLTSPVILSYLTQWFALFTVLIALATISVLPQYGPMKIALNRHRMVIFAQGFGLTFTVLYAIILLGFA